jgi:glycine/D-amino acid oxidase-like deaminating enzyme
MSDSIVIIGGGVLGLMSAYHTKKQMPATDVILLEKGLYIPYEYGSSTRSAACTRQQFGCRHNVEMSMYSTRFFQDFAAISGCSDKVLWQVGYLFLYRDSAACEAAHRRVRDQQGWGLGDVRGLSSDETLRQFPYLLRDELAGATFCPTDGFLSPGVILSAMKEKVLAMGVTIRTGSEIVGFNFRADNVSAVLLKDGTVVPCDHLVNCSGAWSSRIGKMLGTDVPVAPEKRYLWTARIQQPPPQFDFTDDQFARIPMIVCVGVNGMVPYLKPEPGSGVFTMGCEHKVSPDWDFADSDQDQVDLAFYPNVSGGYHESAWLEAASFVGFAEHLGFMPRVASGYYETTKDHNPFLGVDPNLGNVIHAAGFSGHGIMHSPAGGKIVADLLQFGDYRTFPSAKGNVDFEGFLSGTRQTEGMKI